MKRKLFRSNIIPIFVPVELPPRPRSQATRHLLTPHYGASRFIAALHARRCLAIKQGRLFEVFEFAILHLAAAPFYACNITLRFLILLENAPETCLLDGP